MSEIDPSWCVSDEMLRQLDPKEREFLASTIGGKFSPQWFGAHIRRLNIQNYEHVLDVGSGFGPWSLSLGRANRSVTAVEPLEGRLDFARQLLRNNEVKRVNFLNASAEAIPLPDASVDYIFCNGVLWYADMDAALAEFSRVAQPGCRLYFTSISWGWLLHLGLERALLGKRAPNITRRPPFRDRMGSLRFAVQTGLNAAARRPTRAFATDQFLKRHINPQWVRIASGSEGALKQGLCDSLPEPYYKAATLGRVNVREFIYRRK